MRIYVGGLLVVYLPPLMKHVLMTWTRTTERILRDFPLGLYSCSFCVGLLCGQYSEFVYALFLCRHRGFFSLDALVAVLCLFVFGLWLLSVFVCFVLLCFSGPHI